MDRIGFPSYATGDADGSAGSALRGRLIVRSSSYVRPVKLRKTSSSVDCWLVISANVTPRASTRRSNPIRVDCTSRVCSAMRSSADRRGRDGRNRSQIGSGQCAAGDPGPDRRLDARARQSSAPGVSQAMTRPRSMTATRSHSTSASSM